LNIIHQHAVTYRTIMIDAVDGAFGLVGGGEVGKGKSKICQRARSSTIER
jgi:hypothetical protein